MRVIAKYLPFVLAAPFVLIGGALMLLIIVLAIAGLIALI